MKVFAFILALFFSGQLLVAQEQDRPFDYKKRLPKWQVGLVATDVIVPALTLDASFQVKNRHHIGFRLSSPFYQSFYEGDLYQSTNWAIKGGIYHKVFFPLSDKDILTFRHGLRFGAADLAFDATIWESYERFGNTFMEYREVSLSDRPISLGYEALIGWQDNYGPFFFEVYFGLTYEFIQNRSELLAPEYKGESYSLEFNGPGYEYDSGVRPVLGLVLGLTRSAN